MTITSILTITVYIINFLLAFAIIFISRKNASATWAWLFVLFFIPIVGFILFMILGRELQLKSFIGWRVLKQAETFEPYTKQRDALREGTFEFPNEVSQNYVDLVRMNVEMNYALLTNHNETQLFTIGQDKFKALQYDIEQAKHHIHIQYYIFKLDVIGETIYNALIKKAQQGVKVRVLFDDLGSRKLKVRDFQELIEAGGEVCAFFPAFLSMINPRLNCRNHRKVVVIDGEIGYIGGFNIGKEYAGLDEGFGFWRDLHVRIKGEAVHHLQLHFLFDWYQAMNIHYVEMNSAYFPESKIEQVLPIQIVSSGPDTEFESIQESYIRLIMSAKKYIYIQTPYFIPNDAFLKALQIAASSGIDVRVMTPTKTDHPFIYGGNSAFGGDLLKYGGRIFRYKKGFLHTKMMVIDDEICTIGTTNLDIRSFSLNFELNGIFFDREMAITCRELYLEDEKDSFEMTKERYAKRRKWTKVREGFSRLIAPIL
ncbi:MAG: cardiolipin synthase [Lysinibacillus sp.]